jgi:transketolase
MSLNQDEDWVSRVKASALGMRKKAFEQVMKHQGGYFSQVCSSAELLATLYLKILNLSDCDADVLPKAFMGAPSPQRPMSDQGKSYHGYTAPYLDRLIISPSYYALAEYCALIETGRLDEQTLDLYLQDGSSMEILGAPHCPGFELNAQTPLMGLSNAIGICIGRKLKRENGRVWVLCDEKEFASGLAFEILLFLKQMPLNNLVVLIDQRQSESEALKIWKDQVEKYHWTSSTFDAQDPLAFEKASLQFPKDSPLFLYADSHPAGGIPYLAVANLPLNYLRFKNPIERMNFEAALRAFLYQPN